MKKFLLTAASMTGLGLMLGAAPASAKVLLNLINPPVQTDTPYSLSFTATTSSTVISIAGYQLPGLETSSDNGLFLGGTGPNLLGSSWTFTPAASNSYSGTYNDGTSVPGVYFGGFTVGDYDVQSQTIATTPGSSYTLDFLFATTTGGPSDFFVSATLPEPASIALLGAGVFGLSLIRRKRR
jgi:hypothetical protein